MFLLNDLGSAMVATVTIPPLFWVGSLEAARPVFLIVMGVSLAMLAWKLSKNTSGWDGRMMMGGALLLGFGYAILLPMYEAGKIERVSPVGHYHGNPDVALAWHAVKLVAMNGGWLCFGLGLALHAKLIGSPAPTPARSRNPRLSVSRESAA